MRFTTFLVGVLAVGIGECAATAKIVEGGTFSFQLACWLNNSLIMTLEGLVRRQFEGRPEAQMQAAKIFSVETLKPKLDGNAVRRRIRFGPYTVPGAKVCL